MKTGRFAKINLLPDWLLLSLKSALFALVCGSLGACSYLGDSGQSKQAMVIKVASVDCFGQATQTLENYFNRKASLQAVDNLADCAVSAVDEFTKKVISPSTADAYSIGEIDEFFSKYLEKPGTFDADFIDLLFHLKSSAIGGTSTQITRSEMARLRSVILDFKLSLNEIDPYLEILTSRQKIDPNDSQQVQKLEQALSTLDKVAKRLSAHLQVDQTRNSEFSNVQVIALMKKLGLESTLSPYQNLLGSGKSILLGGNDTGISRGEWSVALTTLSQVYSVYLRYNNILRPLPMSHSLAAQSYHLVTNSLLDILDRALAAQTGQIISLPRLQKLIANMGEDNLLPFGLSAGAVNKLLPTVMSKILVDRQKNIAPSGGLGLPEASMIRNDANNWLFGYDVSLKALQPGGQVSFANIHPQSDMEIQTLKEFADLFVGRAFAYDKRGYVTLGSASALPPVTTEQIVELNLKRFVFEAALRAYATDLRRAQNLTGLTDTETQQIYMDLKGVGKDVGFVDPRTPSAGIRTHMEANIFMSVSNGNDYLELREGIEWFNFAISSSSQSDSIYADIATQCPLFEKDVLGKRQIDVVCFRKKLHDNFANYFANLPGMVAFVNDDLKSEEDWQKFLMPFEQAGRPIGFSSEPMDSSAFRAMVTILQYDESIMVRFDLDGDQVLRNNELDAAFPMLRGYIRKLGAPTVDVPVVRGACLPPIVSMIPPKAGPADSEFVQKLVFDYLIRRGSPPPPETWKRILSVPAAGLESLFVKDKVTRLEVMKLIASFATFSAQSQQNDIAYLLKTQKDTLHGDLKAGTCSILRQTMNVFNCDYDSQANLTAFMKTHADSIFAQPNMTPVQFSQAVERELQADPIMKTECLPF